MVPADLVGITTDTIGLIPGEETAPHHVLIEYVSLPAALLREIILHIGLSQICLRLACLLLECLVSLFRL